ncbi:MAG: methionyl-tRNA formyltransferase [Colwellia sp.]
MSTPLNIIFAGTPDFAAKHLQAIINSQHNVVAVYCPPDKPAGRGKKLTSCATKLLALENNIVVEQPVNFKQVEDQHHLATYNADIMIVVAYGLLLPEVILNTPKLGCINVHGSILPEWRGAAPIQRSLEAGDAQTGVTIMQMDKGLDTGDMIVTSRCTIEKTDTSATLYEKLAALGPQALLETLEIMSSPSFDAKTHNVVQDNNLATYAHKLNKEESELDWQLSADVLDRKIRAYIPWPVAQFTFNEFKENGEPKQHKIRVLQASDEAYDGDVPPGTIIKTDKSGILVATSHGALKIESLQLPGKKPLSVKEVLNGRAHWFSAGNSINGYTG